MSDSKYVKLSKLINFKKGDKVEVTRIAEEKEFDWNNTWVFSMNEHVGKIATVTGVDHEYGVNLNIADDYSYPVYVLRLVKRYTKPKPKVKKPKVAPQQFVTSAYSRFRVFNVFDSNKKLIGVKVRGAILTKEHLVKLVEHCSTSAV